MKVDMIKQAGGILVPASDYDAESLLKLKTGEQYQLELKQVRNVKFHRKCFAFFNFCFHHWKSDREFVSEKEQFDVFRSNLTVLAGFYVELYNIKGELRIEAKSLSFASMSQDEFEEVYGALINAALRNIFMTTDDNTYNKLMSFF